MNEISECFNIPNINIEGLMTVGPLTRDNEKIRDSFIQLRALRTRINQSVIQSDMLELSMGMSGDYEIAVEEGSTMIRLGTALLGKRTPYKI